MEKLTVLIRKLASSVVLNSAAVNASGLNSGRMGCSLALYEASQVLGDDYLEDEAFMLLQESILSQMDDLGFHKGWSGIGFALMYLIRNNYLEADLGEVFGERMEQICVFLEDKLRKNVLFIAEELEMLYFVNEMALCDHSKRWEKIRNRMNEKADEKILSLIDRCSKTTVNISRSSVQNQLNAYLNYRLPEENRKSMELVIEKYMDLYHRGLLPDNLVTYLQISKILGNKYSLDGHYGLDWKNRLYVAPLSYQTSVLALDLETSGEQGPSAKWIESMYLTPDWKETEQNIVAYIYKASSMFGLGNGLSRLLILLCMYMKLKDKRDVSPMVKLLTL